MINQTNANATAQGAGFTADINSAENAALLDEETAKLERYYKLFIARKLPASTFKKLTGIDARLYARSRPKPKDPDDFFPTDGNLSDRGFESSIYGPQQPRSQQLDLSKRGYSSSY
jgi:hypothetical protein